MARKVQNLLWLPNNGIPDPDAYNTDYESSDMNTAPPKKYSRSRNTANFHCIVKSQSTYICRVQSCVLRLPKYWPPPPSPPSECVLLPHQRRGVHTRRAVRGFNILEDARHRIGLLQYNLSTCSKGLSRTSWAVTPCSVGGPPPSWRRGRSRWAWCRGPPPAPAREPAGCPEHYKQ